MAIKRHESGEAMSAYEMHNMLKSMYSWREVAKRTEIVYDLIESYPIDYTLVGKLARFKRCGYMGYYIMALIILCDYILMQIIELFFDPADKIERAPHVDDFGRRVKST